MKEYNKLVKINHNPNWPCPPDHSYRERDPFKSKYQLLIDGREKIGIIEL